MAAFDAELYLRLLGETTLAESYDAGPSWASTLGSVALALRAVGAIGEDAARAVLDDYRLAASLRDGDDFPYGFAPPRPAPAPADPPRLVRSNRVLEHPRGLLQVRYVTLAADATTLSIAFRDDAPLPEQPSGLSRRSTSAAFTGWGPPLAHLTDDRGTTTTLTFTGTHDGPEWRGLIAALTPLAPDTAWLELDGARLDLHEERASPDVVVEDVEIDDPAREHLWRLVASSARSGWPTPSLDAIAEALVAAGALPPRDPCLAQLATALHAVDRQRRPDPARAASLPEPWRSLVGRLGRTDGRFGSVPAGVVTPAFEGITVVVSGLVSMLDSWELAVEVVPGTALEPIDDEDADLVPCRLVWWARDDRGNAYLGSVDDGPSETGPRAVGRVEFRPALHPRATRVDVMPTAERKRAVIRLPLEWRQLRDELT